MEKVRASGIERDEAPVVLADGSNKQCALRVENKSVSGIWRISYSLQVKCNI